MKEDADGTEAQRKPAQMGREVRIAVAGFAELYAAAFELPLDRLQRDPVWCADRLRVSLNVDVV